MPSTALYGEVNWTTGVILVVDREGEALEILRSALQSTDYVLLQAKTGDEALSVISRLDAPVDLAVVDLDLGSDGGQIISLLTIFGRRTSTKVIVKTSRQDRSFLEQVGYFGVDAIILKPVSQEQLIKTIHETLSRHRNGSAVGFTESGASSASSHCYDIAAGPSQSLLNGTPDRLESSRLQIMSSSEGGCGCG
jgi:DNA-binding response OmpR family regulator